MNDNRRRSHGCSGRRRSGRRTKPLPNQNEVPPPPPSSLQLTLTDMNILEKLSQTYQNDLEEKQIGYMARYKSIRQSACASVVFILLLQVVGIAFFRQAVPSMSVADAVLFSTYAITSAGYGSVAIPHTTGFLLFVVAYIFIGVCALAILESIQPEGNKSIKVAQTYQYLTLASQRSQHARDKVQGAKRGVEQLDAILHGDTDQLLREASVSDRLVRQELHRSLVQLYKPTKRFRIASLAGQHVQTGIDHDRKTRQGLWKKFVGLLCTRNPKGNIDFPKDKEGPNKASELKRALVVASILTFLLLFTAIGMMILEGWTYIEGIYFAVYSMTTTGYGDYAPSTDQSKWFASCILWFNILFMGLFLSNIAHFFVMVSNMNIRRIERRLRREKETKDSKNAQMRQLMEGVSRTVEKMNSKAKAEATDATIVLPSTESGQGARRNLFNELFSESERIHMEDAIGEKERGTERTIKQILAAIHEKVDKATEDDPIYKYSSNLVFGRQFEKSTLLYDSSVSNFMKKPTGTASLALRVLAEERAARIIAADIAGFDCSSEIKDETHLLMTTDRLHKVAQKWRIPHLARRAFYSVAMEALCVVGENRLLSSGAGAFFVLPASKFEALFSPFTAALGDFKTTETWMRITEGMARTDLPNPDEPAPTFQNNLASNRGKNQEPGMVAPEPASKMLAVKPRRVMKERVDDFFPPNQGNAGLIEHRANTFE